MGLLALVGGLLTKMEEKQRGRKFIKPSRRLQSTFFMVVVCLLIQITTVSAFLDVKHFDKNEGEYGQIEIDDWLFLNKADYKLTDYGTSVINAWAEGEYTLYKKTHLFTGIFYKDILGKEGELKNAEFLHLGN